MTQSSTSRPRREMTGEIALSHDDPMHLQSSDHPGLHLVSVQLNGNNFLPWKRAILIALGAKNKLDFINGKITAPVEGDDDYINWKKVDYMVTSWILNSMSTDIVEGFLYVDSAFQLWEIINQRFGESNAPLIFSLQKDIANIKQGNSSVVLYFTKLNRLWDECAALAPLPLCGCAKSKDLLEMDSRNKLMQFLMGLNETYGSVTSQILLMDQFPNVNKAYSLILQEERKRNVHTMYPDSADVAAAVVQQGKDFGNRGRGNVSRGRGQGWNSTRGRGLGRGFTNRKTKEERAHLFCEHCGYNGHEQKECFKLHGYPEWYKEYKEKTGKGYANQVETIENSHKGIDMASLAQELMKYMGSKSRTLRIVKWWQKER
ncbi:Unknown protein [Striga hermonthica]|uniref:CCHC-type domain-containing protein n=1 Tax=Striga hermonthica TaxID=68872 RepID=A0A9N7RJG8_STRHE|nr:Unknown protein [Striga hermonthica]